MLLVGLVHLAFIWFRVNEERDGSNPSFGDGAILVLRLIARVGIVSVLCLVTEYLTWDEPYDT